jgi:hypothetical protein
MTSRLPSQCQPNNEDKAYERGFIFGRASVIRAVREAIDKNYPLDQLLTELTNVEFNRL